MEITPDTKFYIDDKRVDCVSILDEEGKVLDALCRVDTTSGMVVQYVRGHDGNLVTLDPGGSEFATKTSYHRQLFFAVTAGPSEEVLREIVEEALVGVKGDTHA
jgi:hypothetical protein